MSETVEAPLKTASYELAEFKTLDEEAEEPPGLFAALVSAFGNVDRSGDRVMPGAFRKSIQRWRESGDPIPVIWSHEWRNPDDYIGQVDPQHVKETSEGLVVAGKLEINANPRARRVYDLLRDGLLKEWSFGYEVKDERLAKDLARELYEVDLIEVGPTLKGANPEVRTLAVKEADASEESVTEPLQPNEPEIEAKQVDDSAWDGDRAMGMCDSAADFRSIAFERDNDSDPDTAAHWALPHHYLGRPPNARGVAAAVGALNGARGGAPDLKDSGRARSHLESHQGREEASAPETAAKLDPIIAKTLEGFDHEIDELIDEKIGRVISGKTEAKIRAAMTALKDILASLGEETEQVQDSSPPKSAVGEKELLRLQLTEAGTFLAERNR